MEREKVIKELEECIEHIRINEFEKISCWGNCQIAMMEALGLLKEKEPVEPISRFNKLLNKTFYWCGKCEAHIEENQSYCSCCGQKVKWNA